VLFPVLVKDANTGDLPLDIEGDDDPEASRAAADQAKSTDDLVDTVLTPEQLELAAIEREDRDLWWSEIIDQLDEDIPETEATTDPVEGVPSGNLFDRLDP